MRKQKEGQPWPPLSPMAAPLSSLHSLHHRNMKMECSYHKEDDPLLRSLVHALKQAMEFVSSLLPLLSMVWRPWRAPPDDPRFRGNDAALRDRVRSGITALMSHVISSTTNPMLFALRIDVCEQQQEYLRKARCDRPKPSEFECPTYESFMTELGDQRDRYAKWVEEIDGLKVQLGKLQSKLDEPTLSGELECESCPCLARELAVLKEKFEGQLKELEELRARPALLGAWMVYATLRGKLEQLRADFEVLSAPTDTFLENLREELLSLQDDNNRLREVLSWVYARQPQLEMIIESTNRAEGDMSGFGFGECSTTDEKSGPIKIKTAPTQPGETVDGVYHEPPKAALEKQYWTPKASKAKLDKIIEEELMSKSKKPVQQPEPPKATPLKPKS
ncbi:hypothetical protein U9M48_024637 [Paspalum notatum var. saurae]|uniref:Uncharacterized protein n=1 Tax=Paspalum notatum var. saurae TaxID=547442 RepID=A0AAQ3TP64_PASNO